MFTQHTLFCVCINVTRKSENISVKLENVNETVIHKKYKANQP
jgi:hypothetical protein